MHNSFTVDVEDWFCSHNLQQTISYGQWHDLESRVVQNTHELLGLLSRYKVKATFFVLGWVAEKYPGLVRDIASMGHEIGTHGFAHQLVTHMTQDAFKKDIHESILAIRAAAGCDAAGYRAPAFSITQKTLWALPVLKDAGIEYDSSVYPFSYHPDYGLPGASQDITEIIPGLREVPLSCANSMGMRIPCSGGAYLRFFPYSIFKKLVNNVTASGRPFNFYIHPWELDKDIPRVKLSFSKRIRHYANLHTTKNKLELLLQDFEFTSVQNILCRQ